MHRKGTLIWRVLRKERARGETEVKSRSKKQKSSSAWEGWERAVFWLSRKFE